MKLFRSIRILVCFVALCFYFVTFCIAQEPKFITMPDDVNSKLIKSVYENTVFSIVNYNDGYYKHIEDIKGKKELKDVWVGSSIKDKTANADSLTLYFKPKNYRKIGNTVLEDFNVNFFKKDMKFKVKHSKGNEIILDYYREAKQQEIMTNNKSDILIFVPKQSAYFDSVGLMICPRVFNRNNKTSEMSFIDTGYAIDKVKMNFRGETKASFTTGNMYKGKIDLKIYNTQTIAEPELVHDISQMKDPRVELSYLPVGEKVASIMDDENIVGGLKFFYDMQYDGGNRRVSDFTNYVWIRKNYIDLPFKLRKKIAGNYVSVNVKEGICYNVVLNAKIFSNTYLDNNLNAE